MAYSGLFHTEEIGAPLRVVQVLGLTSTAFYCGIDLNSPITKYHILTKTGRLLTQSLTTPALLLAPAPLLADQWVKITTPDKYLAPLTILFSGGIYTYLSYREPRWTTTSILNTISSTLLLATIPYSMVYMHPITEKLKSKAASLSSSIEGKQRGETGVKTQETVHFLVDRWATLNLSRVLLTGLSAALATWAAVGKWQIRELRVGVEGVQRR